MTRVRIVKTILWALVGAALVALVARFVNGLGATTNLTDVTPWGLWIGLKLAGVAFAAGGFSIAATVYIFQLHAYHALARRSVLLGLLGYTFFVVSLIVDLGIPWNIWRPVFFWNHHSPLFEVAWCVMLYLTVLLLEFAPVVLEKYRQRWRVCDLAYRALKVATIPIVIFGIGLSVLHQSSLGTLFAIMPHRQHPLFYSPIINVQFFVSCVAMGLAAVIVESHIAHYLYRRSLRDGLLRQLGRVMAWIVWLFAAIRFGDLWVRGDAAYLTEHSWSAALFWLEMGPLLILPSLLVQFRRVRDSRVLLGSCAFLVVCGVLINRVSVAGLSMIAPTGTSYLPSGLELLMSFGLVPGVAVLIWMFLVEGYEVWEPEPHLVAVADPYAPPDVDQPSGVWIGDSALADFRRYSLAFAFGAAATFALLPAQALHGSAPVPQTVVAARGRDILRIDGNRDNWPVYFKHADHIERLGRQDSCVGCHHASFPLDADTPCASCHRDMWSTSDIFDHDWHADRIAVSGAEDACAACHPEAAGPKARDTAVTCSSEGCHRDANALLHADSRIVSEQPDRARLAVGYMDAMHGLCIPCHRERAVEVAKPRLDQCSTCHETGMAVHEEQT